MTTSEFYFLTLVCGAFGVFAVAMMLGTLRDKAYARSLMNSDNRKSQN